MWNAVTVWGVRMQRRDPLTDVLLFRHGAGVVAVMMADVLRLLTAGTIVPVPLAHPRAAGVWFGAASDDAVPVYTLSAVAPPQPAVWPCIEVPGGYVAFACGAPIGTRPVQPCQRAASCPPWLDAAAFGGWVTYENAPVPLVSLQAAWAGLAAEARAQAAGGAQG